MRGSRSTDYDWIIYDIIYILITLTRGSGEPGLQANVNKTLLLAADWVQTGLEFKYQPQIEFQRGEEAAVKGKGGLAGAEMEMERDGIADISW